MPDRDSRTLQGLRLSQWPIRDTGHLVRMGMSLPWATLDTEDALATILMRAYVMQPPALGGYLGFWEGVLRSDALCLWDHVQFEPKSWQSRNRIKGVQGEVWLSVPVKTAGRQFQRICDVEIVQDGWNAKHWRTLTQCYARAPHSDYLDLFGSIYADPPSKLVLFNQSVICAVMDALQIDRPVTRSSTFGDLPAGMEAPIIAALHRLGADTLVDSAGAQPLLDPQPFADAGITLEFQHYTPVPYVQQHGDFLPYLSVLDCLLNLGPDATKEVILAGAH